ncbi:MAG: hypothetical protein DRR19_25365 [Candidatus Parabeggiatoa sp. nov. 1]|nr:MAG: hypothetical protein DRR19_25365 [Gammaproteobacteria bacterium]
MSVKVKNNKKGVMRFSQQETIIKLQDERQLKALSGVTELQLETLAAEFELVEQEAHAATEAQAINHRERVRKPGGGRKGILTTAIQKVL